jgi:hypothetical protein
MTWKKFSATEESQVAKIASQDHVDHFISTLPELSTASLFLKTPQ